MPATFIIPRRNKLFLFASLFLLLSLVLVGCKQETEIVVANDGSVKSLAISSTEAKSTFATLGKNNTDEVKAFLVSSKMPDKSEEENTKFDEYLEENLTVAEDGDNYVLNVTFTGEYLTPENISHVLDGKNEETGELNRGWEIAGGVTEEGFTTFTMKRGQASGKTSSPVKRSDITIRMPAPIGDSWEITPKPGKKAEVKVDGNTISFRLTSGFESISVTTTEAPAPATEETEENAEGEEGGIFILKIIPILAILALLGVALFAGWIGYQKLQEGKGFSLPFLKKKDDVSLPGEGKRKKPARRTREEPSKFMDEDDDEDEFGNFEDDEDEDNEDDEDDGEYFQAPRPQRPGW